MAAANITPARSIGSFEQAAALGQVSGVVHMRKFGYNDEVDAGVVEDVIGGGGTYAGQPADATAETIEILHPNAADNSSSTGMKTVRIVGLKTPTSTAYESEDITLTGVATDSASAWWRIVSLRGLTFGSGGTNAGTITARSKTTTAEIFAVIQVGVGRSQIAVFTCPAECTVAIRDIYISGRRPANGNGNAVIHMMVRPSGSGGYAAADDWNITMPGGPAFGYQRAPFIMNAGDDLIVEAHSVSANTTSIAVNFDAFIYDNDILYSAS